MKRFIICFIILSPLGAIAQSKIDTILTTLNRVEQDSNRVTALNSLSWEYASLSKYKEGLAAGESALLLGEKLQYKKGVAIAYNNIGFIYHKQGNFPKALENHLASLKLREELHDTVGVATSYNNIGIVYERLNNFPEALEYHLASLKIKLKIGKKKPIAASYNNIGNIYFAQGNYPLALENYEASLKLKIELKDKKGTASGYNNIGAIYQTQKKYEKALENYLRSLDIKSALQDKYGIAVANNNIGGLYLEQNKIVEAKRHQEMALKYAHEIGAIDVMMIVYSSLASCDSALGNYKGAYLFHRKYKQYSDTLFNKENSQKMAEMAELYENEKKGKQITELELEKKNAALDLAQSANQRKLFIAFTVGLLVTAILIYSQFRQKKKSNHLLTEKNVVIEKSLHERESLLKEIHHRVKNNLQIISSLLSLQSKSLTDTDAQGAITESRNRVKSMSLIHEQLYQEDTISGVDMKDYIQRLVQSLSSSYGLDTDRIEMEIVADSILLDVDSAIPLGLIINELVSNSMKYAFPEKSAGVISVSLRERANELLLVVQDNGVGMDASIKSDQSFGLSMVRSLMRKLKAEMTMVSNAGTSVELVITDFKKVTVG